MKLIDNIRVDRIYGANEVPISVETNGFGDSVDYFLSYHNGEEWIELDDPIEDVSGDLTDDMIAAVLEPMLSADAAENNIAELIDIADDSLDTGKSAEAVAEPEPKRELLPEERNFRYEGMSPQPRGRVSRLRGNLEAIKLAKQISNEARLATPEEKEVLAKYNGFGADKEVFNDAYTYWRDSEKTGGYRPREAESWEKEYGEWHDRFKELLDADEWRGASASILNAHYTNGEVSRSLWTIAERMGFEGGKVLEPGCGCGNIMGAVPEHLADKVEFVGVEKDPITALIAYHLYPQADIQQGSFDEADIRTSTVDMVIANVPFSENGPAGTDYNLHNFFISHSLTKLKPGGVCICITSSSTMENNADQRARLAEKGELIGAIRLPHDAFMGNANTEVVTDILVLRKRNGLAINHEEWTQKLPVTLPSDGQFTVPMGYGEDDKILDKALVNEYYVRHPKQVLGYHSLNGKMYGRDNDKGQYTVSSGENPLPIADRLYEAISNLPENILKGQQGKNTLVDFDSLHSDVPDEAHERAKDLEPGSFFLQDGTAYIVEGRAGEGYTVEKNAAPLPWEVEGGEFKFPRKFNRLKATELVEDFVRLRDAHKTLIQVDFSVNTTEDESTEYRQDLRNAYEQFKLRWGELNADPGIYRLLKSDTAIGAALALEEVKVEKNEAGKKVMTIEPAEILKKRTIWPDIEPTASTLEEAIYVSMSQMGRVDPSFIADLLGVDVDGVDTNLRRSDLVFSDPESGDFILSEYYLSGNVRKKLAQAEKALIVDSRFERNVNSLKESQPTPIVFENISAPLGSNWIPPSVISEFFVRELQANPSSYTPPRYFPGIDKWVVEDNYLPELQARYSTPEYEGSKVLDAALNHTHIKIYAKDSNGNSYYLAKESNAANGRKEALCNDFTRWLKSAEDQHPIIEDIFNEKFNSVVLPKYDGSHMKFPGLVKFKPRDHQASGVTRMLIEQQGVFAHAVGYGKTLQLIMTGYESRRLGLARKPMIVPDNPSYPQFVATAREAYPQARILASDEESMNAKNRKIFLNRVATGDYDMILMPQSHFDRIPVSPATVAKYISKEIEDQRRVLEDMKRGDSAKRSQRRIEKAIEKAEEKLKELAHSLSENYDDNTFWEDLGVDLLEVDEIHKYKKTGLRTSYQNVKGVDTGKSQRGMNLLMKAGHIQERRGGRGVIGATGTPVTNTMAEAWNMAKITSPETLSNFCIETFDEFAGTFCQTVTGMELNESNNKWRNVTRLAKFINGPSLVQFMRSYLDVQMEPIAELNLPKIKGGETQINVVDLTDSVADILEEISDVYEAYERSSDKQELSFVPIMLMQVGMATAIDPRLIKPNAPDEPGSLINQAADKMAEIYKMSVTDKTPVAQIAFCDRYRSMDTSALDRVQGEGLSADIIDLDGDDFDANAEAEDEDEEVIQEKRFNLYEDLREKLAARGIPREKVLIITEAKNATERGEMFDAVNDGRAAVIIGSTMKLGTGVNVQKRLYAAHHIDPPRDMTPASMIQRDGRLIRSGNEFAEVENIYYGMKDTATPGVIHRIQRKDAFIRQALSGKGVGVEFEDCGEVRLEDMKSALISDKRQLNRAELLYKIKEERTKIEVEEDFINSQKWRLRNNESWVERQELEVLPRDRSLAEWYKKSVRPPDSTSTEDFFLLVGKNRIEGEDKVDKWLKLRLDTWKEHKLGFGDSEPLETIHLNGLELRIRHERYRSIVKGDSEDVLTVTARAPGDNRQGSDGKFRTIDALKKVVQRSYEHSQQRLAQHEAELVDAKKSSVSLRKTLEGRPPIDFEPLNKLETELEVLEADMRENPYERRRTGKRTKKDQEHEAESIEGDDTELEVELSIARAVV